MTGGNLNASLDQRITKTYFVVNRLKSSFPIEFLQSRNQKWIVVQNCRCIYNGFMTGDIMLHADFIERDRYLDSFCSFTNTILKKYKKWEVINPKQFLTVWFTDIKGNPVNINLDIKPGEQIPPDTITDVVIELMLIY
jgi:hypothetical protein